MISLLLGIIIGFVIGIVAINFYNKWKISKLKNLEIKLLNPSYSLYEVKEEIKYPTPIIVSFYRSFFKEGDLLFLVKATIKEIYDFKILNIKLSSQNTCGGTKELGELLEESKRQIIKANEENTVFFAFKLEDEYFISKLKRKELFCLFLSFKIDNFPEEVYLNKKWVIPIEEIKEIESTSILINNEYLLNN